MAAPRHLPAIGLAGWLAAAVFAAGPSSQGTRPAPAAADPQEDPAAYILRHEHLVVVPVTVKDGRGGLVQDIRREEFYVKEDGVLQELALYSAEAFPLSMAILIDNALGSRQSEHVQRTAGAIAAGLSPADEAAVMLFDEFPLPASELIRDNDRIYDLLKRLELGARPSGAASGPMTSGPRINAQPVGPGVPGAGIHKTRSTKNLDLAVQAGADLLRCAARDRRKIILVISDGRSARDAAVNFQAVRRLLLSRDISVYAIALGRGPLRQPVEPLERYARATGGDVFYADSREALENAYGRVSEQARNQYTLGYFPQKTDRSADYHEVEVVVRRPGLELRARDGYFVLPAP